MPALSDGDPVRVGRDLAKVVLRDVWAVPMKYLFLLLLLLPQAPDPAHPWPNHELPPAGWFCVPTDTAERLKTDPHACECLGMIDDPICSTAGQDENGNTVELPRSNDNSKCRVFCHKDHCACMKQCEGS